MPSYPGVKANRSRGETFQDGWSANLPPQKLSSEGFIYTEISTSSYFVIAGILLTVFSMVPGCVSAPANHCPSPDYIKQENGFCCGVVSCEKNFTVSMCKVNYGNDTCFPCPEGSFLLDSTTSVTATSCIKPECQENRTRPSLVKSTTINPRACPQWCQCDISLNYCGTDPCRCDPKTCHHGEILLQNCGCMPITPSPPKSTPPKEIPVTKITSSTPRIDVSTFPPGTTTASDRQPKQSHDKAVAAVVAVAVFIFIVVWCIWKQRGNNRSGNRNRGADGASEDPAGFPLIPGNRNRGADGASEDPAGFPLIPGNSNRGADGASEDPAGFPLIPGAKHVNRASNQDIPRVIALHNEMVDYLDRHIFGEDLIRLKNFFKEIPLTSADIDNIHKIYHLFEHLMKNEIISYGSYTKFISNLRQINPYQATYVEKKEKEMKEIIKRGIPTVVIGQTKYSFTTGQSATLGCTVTTVPAATSITWEKTDANGNTNTINVNGVKYTGGTTGTPSLTIVSAVTTDSGNYRCSATNSTGTGQSEQTYLYITGGSGGGTDENITAGQERNDIGSNRNSTAEDPDESDSSAGEKGNGSGTDENVTVEQPQNDIGSNRNSTAEDPDEGDSPAGEKSICKLS